jgi:hypothetical protein
MEDMTCLYLLTGQSTCPKALYWRSQENTIAVECLDRRVYLWDLDKGALQRIEESQAARDLIESYEIRLR